MHFVYILMCRDGRDYVGLTEDVSKRLAIHRSGKGPRFTANRLPVELVYQEEFTKLESAVPRERQLKGWTRAKKEALIRGDMESLKKLSSSSQSKQS